MKKQINITVTVEVPDAPSPESHDSPQTPSSEPRELENLREEGRAGAFSPEGHAMDLTLYSDLFHWTLKIADESMQSVTTVHFLNWEHFLSFGEAIRQLETQILEDKYATSTF